MTKAPSVLKGSTAAVLGFNARPIASSANTAGARVIVSDYWGDEDLNSCSSKWVAVLSPVPGKRQRTPLKKPVHESLVENLLQITKDEKIDHVFVGSGFDDHFASLSLLEEHLAITGNSTEQMESARDRHMLAKLAESIGLSYPTSLHGHTIDEAISKCEDLGYPCIVRPPASGGGSGITLISHPSQIEKACWRLEAGLDSEVIIQEYIAALDGSCSVLSTGDDAVALSIQGQLIGMPSAGRNCDFVYSGNYYPLALSKKTRQKIKTSSVSICTTLGLLGSNGIDFLVDKDERIWLMEVNPRFQGSLELLESTGRFESKRVSLTELHVAACQGLLPKRLPSFTPSVKLVVFSRGTGRVPDLSKFKTAVDRTPEGVIMKRGDPVCTVIESAETLIECYRQAITASAAIQRGVLNRPD